MKRENRAAINLRSLDHLVLTVGDVDATAAWYEQVLGMKRVEFGGGRLALSFGSQKINLHPADVPYTPHAAVPQRGSADLCFLTDTPLEVVLAHLEHRAIPILAGPVIRTGATGPIRSVYFRDPDGNLIEVASSAEGDGTR